MKTLLLVASVAALLSTPALAKPVAPSVSVDYSDLDLSTKSGQKTLDRRIAAAARSVCPNSLKTGTRIAKPDRCYANAIESVRQELAGKGIGAVVASR